MPTRRLTSRQEAEDWVHGLVLFGTGGGGGPAPQAIERLWTAMQAGVPVGWTDIDELDDDSWTLSLAGVGGKTPADGPDPALLQRTGLTAYKFTDPLDMLLTAAQTLLSLYDAKLGGVVAVELGSYNTITPMLAAARLGVELVDGDYCGRAKPEIHQSTLEIEGRGVWPLVFVDRWGDVVHIPEAISAAMIDRIGRHLCSAAFGGISVARTLTPVREARISIVRGSCEAAYRAGRLLREARERGDDPVAMLIKDLGGVHLFDGIVERTEEESESGYQFHLCTHHLTGTGAFSNHSCAIWVKNEHHIVWVDGKPRATSPDIISVHDRETGLPLTNHEIGPGRTVAVVAVPPLDARWRTPKGIELLGPRAFGFDFDPVAVGSACESNQ